jgi:hypothetical protein
VAAAARDSGAARRRVKLSEQRYHD